MFVLPNIQLQPKVKLLLPGDKDITEGGGQATNHRCIPPPKPRPGCPPGARSPPGSDRGLGGRSPARHSRPGPGAATSRAW